MQYTSMILRLCIKTKLKFLVLEGYQNGVYIIKPRTVTHYCQVLLYCWANHHSASPVAFGIKTCIISIPDVYNSILDAHAHACTHIFLLSPYKIYPFITFSLYYTQISIERNSAGIYHIYTACMLKYIILTELFQSC